MAAIRPFVGPYERVFDPELIGLMVDAHKRAMRKVRRIANSSGVAEQVAKQIIELTACGVRDPAVLAARALDGLDAGWLGPAVRLSSSRRPRP